MSYAIDALHDYTCEMYSDCVKIHLLIDYWSITADQIVKKWFLIQLRQSCVIIYMKTYFNRHDAHISILSVIVNICRFIYWLISDR